MMNCQAIPSQNEQIADYSNTREAMRLSGIGYAKLLRLALLGSVRTLLLPGRSPMYCREDLGRIAARDGR
jgi:hypothetical protein